MPKNELSLTPKTGLVVPQAPVLSTAEQAVLAELYLPLIGPVAYSLLAALRGLQSPNTELSNRRSHTELLGILNVDLPTMVAARQKLEATALLKTYFQQDDLGEVYLYLLQPPMSATKFFADDLLSVLLLDTVGELRYQQLADRFTPPVVNVEQAQNVSANLLDVFHIDSQKVTHVPTEIQTVRAEQATSAATPPIMPDLTDEAFDWQVLGQILRQNYVDLKQVAGARQLIVTESRVYGISEIEMAKLISEVASLTTGQFDEGQLKLLIARRYERSTADTKDQLATRATAASESVPAETVKLSASEQQLVAYATETTPYDFLDELKKQKHGFVTSGENRLIHDLVNRGVLPNGVINMLVYYLIENRNLAALNKNLLETVANDWQQHDLMTPEAALAYVRERQQPKSSAPKRPTRARNGRTPRKEIVPKWAQKQANGTTKTTGNQITEAQRKQLAERLAKLDSNAEKGD